MSGSFTYRMLAGGFIFLTLISARAEHAALPGYRPLAPDNTAAEVESLLATLSTCGVDRPFVNIPNNAQVAAPPAFAFPPTPLLPPVLGTPLAPQPAASEKKNNPNPRPEKEAPQKDEPSSSETASNQQEDAGNSDEEKPTSHDLEERMRTAIFSKHGCVGCHGPQGSNRKLFDEKGHVLGEKEARNIAAAFNGKIASSKMREIMDNVKSSLSQSDSDLVEEWIAAHTASEPLPKPKPERPIVAPKEPSAAEKAAAAHFKSACIDCHGPDTSPEFFQAEGFLKDKAKAGKILSLYKSLDHLDEDHYMREEMPAVIEALSPADKANLNAWAEELELAPPFPAP